MCFLSAFLWTKDDNSLVSLPSTPCPRLSPPLIFLASSILSLEERASVVVRLILGCSLHINSVLPVCYMLLSSHISIFKNERPFKDLNSYLVEIKHPDFLSADL